MSDYNFQGKLMELGIRILFDLDPPSKADALYIFAQTADNQDGLFDPALGLYKNGDAGKIVICGESGRNGYPGFYEWQTELVSRGAKQEDIIGIKSFDDGVNTLSEAKSLVSFAKKEGWKKVYAVSAPFHQVRAFITLVSILEKIYPSLMVFNKPAPAMPWNEPALHSQGTLKASRSELVRHEFDRIVKYHKQGDLISCSEVLDYLNRRDANTT